MKLSASKPKRLCTLQSTPRVDLFVSWCVWRNKLENDSGKRSLLSISLTQWPDSFLSFLLHSFRCLRKTEEIMHTTSGRMTNIWREIVIARHLSLFDSRKRRFKKRNGPRRKKKENGERAKTVYEFYLHWSQTRGGCLSRTKFDAWWRKLVIWIVRAHEFS